MSHRYVKGIAAAMILGLGVAACSSSGHSGKSGSGTTAKTTSITEEAVTGVTFTKNFNPFDVNSFASQVDAKSLLYEPLFEFNALKPGDIHPELGTKYAWSNGGKTLTVNLRTGVKFSDGQPFTSADAAFTFNTIKSNAAANYSGLPTITSVAAPNASTLVLNFQAAQYANLFSILGNTFMVPKHTFSSLSNVATAAVANPVGTGPYMLKTFTTQQVTFVSNPKWWGGKPAINQVNIPYYSGNQAATTALAAGQLDWAGNEIPNLKQLYTSKDPTHNHYWFPGGNTVTLWINQAKGGPLADPKVRQAISAGINRQQLSVKGEYGYEAPASSSSGLILPAQQQFLDSKLANDLSPTANAGKVASILTADGYKKDSKSIWAKSGKEISFSVEDPTAFTDYYADAQLIAGQMKAVGINATVGRRGRALVVHRRPGRQLPDRRALGRRRGRYLQPVPVRPVPVLDGQHADRQARGQRGLQLRPVQQQHGPGRDHRVREHQQPGRAAEAAEHPGEHRIHRDADDPADVRRGLERVQHGPDHGLGHPVQPLHGPGSGRPGSGLHPDPPEARLLSEEPL